MYSFIKRLIDIVFVVFGLLLLVPISFVIKISFLCFGDTGKILYKQKRVGKDGKPFLIYKYRSMIHNADEMLEQMLNVKRYREEWDENQKIENDPRITKVGKFLRKSSLDELPQILNVLKGDMTLVGPRPLVEGELESHGGSKIYWKVKPGVTGWWACHGRSDIDYSERLEMEYYYIQHQSIKLDLICICKTVIAVMSHKGAV